MIPYTQKTIPVTNNRTAMIFFWVLRFLAALIMLQTLFFKFSGAEESVYIFSTLGIEPWGRIGTGCLELIASILILIPKTTGIGAVLGLGVMSGALFVHFTRLGLVVKKHAARLFIYCLIVFLSCLVLAWSFKNQLCISNTRSSN